GAGAAQGDVVGPNEVAVGGGRYDPQILGTGFGVADDKIDRAGYAVHRDRDVLNVRDGGRVVGPDNGYSEDAHDGIVLALAVIDRDRDGGRPAHPRCGRQVQVAGTIGAEVGDGWRRDQARIA